MMVWKMIFLSRGVFSGSMLIFRGVTRGYSQYQKPQHFPLSALRIPTKLLTPPHLEEWVSHDGTDVAVVTVVTNRG